MGGGQRSSGGGEDTPGGGRGQQGTVGGVYGEGRVSGEAQG